MSLLLFVGFGGAAGAMFRYLSVEAIRFALGPGFPFGTLFVNVLGSFLAGLLAGVLIDNPVLSERTHAFLMIGFLGGYTTFSAFSLDVWHLIESGRIGLAVLYIALSTILALTFLVLGLLLARHQGIP
ncbi:MAG: fluoride efflux transporter CrcB [Rhodobacteraceae bacterium]|nr:fluoride efflux transporter CrcB [Paracoccaceae bacterium]